ncbi:hypothetical protein ZEAMMB73_Zm00001d046076 [Zea mays]|uniref:Uncharacterized protein n=1 Tax=Zea mays TaxID=4577 RepID=A0A1D6P0V0_MAIZE|nr:hypothetical protein ZEAMMB73_Zm00001d046076 [Zea mays]
MLNERTALTSCSRARLFHLLAFTPRRHRRRRRRRRKRRCSTSTCSAPTRAATWTLFASPSAVGLPPSSSSTRSSPSTRHGTKGSSSWIRSGRSSTLPARRSASSKPTASKKRKRRSSWIAQTKLRKGWQPKKLRCRRPRAPSTPRS